MTVLDVQDLWVSYGGVRALQGVSLSVDAGQCVVLLGANGAGKTTLLKTISNLLAADSGTIKLWGDASLRRPAHEITALGVAHVPEGRGVFSQLSVRENLLMGAYLVPQAQLKARFDEVFELFPRLQERWRQTAGNLSGGEQQMVALARALVMQPKLLLLDEPSLGLAPLLAKETFQAIRRIHERGVSVLLVEQNAKLALSIANYAYVLRNGQIETQGPAHEVASLDVVQRAYIGVA